MRRAIDGVIVNQRLSPSVLKTAGGRKKFKDLLKAFVALGGFHWQFNVISTDVLKDAQANPAEHGDLRALLEEGGVVGPDGQGRRVLDTLE